MGRYRDGVGTGEGRFGDKGGAVGGRNREGGGEV